MSCAADRARLSFVSPQASLGFIGLSAAIAAAMVWYGSSNGIGLSPDSMAYLEAARSLLRGDGLMEGGAPLTRYPPVYPVALAVSGAVVGDLIAGARVLHSGLFACTVLVVGWAVRAVSCRSPLATILAMVSILSVAGVVELHLMAWSEPLFLGTGLITLVALSRWVASGRTGWLGLGVVTLSAAMLTRYVGITLLVPMVGAAWILWRRRSVRSAALTLLAAAAGALPLLVWLIRNAQAAGSATQRAVGVHPPGIADWRELAYTLSYWVFPSPVLPVVVRGLVSVGSALALVGLLVGGLRVAGRRSDLPTVAEYLRFLLAVFAASYIGFLVLSRTVVDAHTRFDSRILSPVAIAAIVGASTLVGVQRTVAGHGFRRGLGFVLLWGAILAANIPWTWHVLSRGHSVGFGYADRAWSASETLEHLRALTRDRQVYSNLPEVIRVFLDRPAEMVPLRTLPATGEANPNFEHDLVRMWDDVVASRGVVVYFDGGASRTYLPDAAQIERLLPLEVRFHGADGMVWAADPAAGDQRGPDLMGAPRGTPEPMPAGTLPG